MGIFVPEATLPTGIKLSNVYMSFSGEVVFVSQLGPNAAANPAQARFNPAIVWHISSSYKVYLSKPKRGQDSNIKVPFSITVEVFDKSPYDFLYKALMNYYPSAQSVIEPWQVIVKPTSNLVVSNATLVTIYKDLNSDSNNYVIEEGTSNLVFTQDLTSQFANTINSFTFTIVPEEEEETDDGDVPVSRASALIEESLNNP